MTKVETKKCEHPVPSPCRADGCLCACDQCAPKYFKKELEAQARIEAQAWARRSRRSRDRWFKESR